MIAEESDGLGITVDAVAWGFANAGGDWDNFAANATKAVQADLNSFDDTLYDGAFLLLELFGLTDPLSRGCGHRGSSCMRRGVQVLQHSSEAACSA